jgi:hypothetical protein
MLKNVMLTPSWVRSFLGGMQRTSGAIRRTFVLCLSEDRGNLLKHGSDAGAREEQSA